MMDREQWDAWLRREAQRIEAAHRVRRFATWGYYVAEMQERCAPPVSAATERFIAELQRDWGRR